LGAKLTATRQALAMTEKRFKKAAAMGNPVEKLMIVNN
jgi:hypothetical protein